MSWSYKTTIDPADRLFSEHIRNRDGWKCKLKFKCTGVIDFSNNRKGLACCHYHGRVKRTVRFDGDNADAGCTLCHRYYDEEMPRVLKEEWKKNQLGEIRFRNLNVRANRSRVAQKPDKKMELIYVKAIIEENRQVLEYLITPISKSKGKKNDTKSSKK